MECRAERILSSSLREEREIRICNKGKNLVLVLHPYGYGKVPFLVGNPKYPSFKKMESIDAVFVEPDASLPIRSGITNPPFEDMYMGSWYHDSEYVGKYASFIVEVARLFKERYEIKGRTAVIGGSMGGWGAINLTLKYPDIFSIGASADGPMIYGKSLLFLKEGTQELARIMGTTVEQVGEVYLDMARSLDIVYTGGKLLKSVSYINGKVLYDESLFEKIKLNFPLQVVETYRANIVENELILITNYYDTGIAISNSLMHNKMLQLHIPHHYQCYVGPKVASHIIGVANSMSKILELLGVRFR
ncbi:hypothetical protein HS7_10180 [Sulfolobales archaeon HS-7]|nr:hypothetical protein HS7_10180 [Sulfolobales archaeon HS-7]